MANGVAVDSSDNIIAVGYSYNGSNTDFITIKYNSSGAPVWSGMDGAGGIARIYNGGAEDSVNGVAIDSGNNIIVTGDTANGANIDFYTIKYNSAGTELWYKTYDNSAVANSRDKSNAVSVDSSDNIIVAGSSRNNIVTTESDFYTIKYNKDGDVLGGIRFENDYNAAANGVAVDSAGNVIVTGFSTNSSFETDFRTIKYNAALGAEIWNNTYTVSEHSNDAANGIAVDGSDNVIVAGEIAGNLTWNYGIVKYNSSGAKVWDTFYDSGYTPDSARAVAVDSDNNIFVTGYVKNKSNPIYDIFTIKFRSDATSELEILRAQSGQLASIEIIPTGVFAWNQFSWTDTAAASGAIKYTLEAWNDTASEWEVPILHDNIGFSNGLFRGSPVDISSLSYSVFKKVRLKVNFLNDDAAIDPTLSDWQISWVVDNTPPTIISAVTGDLTGAGLNKVLITFSEKVDAAGVLGAGWTVTGTDAGGRTVTANTDPAGAINTIVLNLSAVFVSEDPDATITYTNIGAGNLVDASVAKNELASVVSPNITDGIKPTNQDVVFPFSVIRHSGENVNINSSGDAANNIWFAPSGTAVFAASANMTKAVSGITTATLAPVTLGDYKLFVIDAAGNRSAGSIATLTVIAPVGGGGGGGGGGSYTPMSAVSNMSISINNGAATTDKIAVTLTIGATNAVKMLISNTIDFAGATWEAFAVLKEWTLTAGEGTKTVYVKFQDASGIFSTGVYDTIVFSTTGNSALIYPDGTLIKTAESPKVFLIKEHMKKWIPVPEVFETMGYKWDNITLISPLDMDRVPFYEDTLIKAINDYKVHLVVNGFRRHILNQEIFMNYGFKWIDVKDVFQANIDKYQRAYVVRESWQKNVYYVSPSGVRKLVPTPEIFALYNNRWEDVQVISHKEMSFYPESNIMRHGGKLYLISGVYKHLIPTDAIFKKNNYDAALILDANKKDFDWYKTGAAVK